MINSSRSLMSVFVDVLIVRGGRRGIECRRVRRDCAGGGVAPHFRPGEERFVTGAINCAHGNEEAVSGIKAKRLWRDQLTIAFGNSHALAIEVLIYGSGGNDEVVDVTVLGAVEV